MAAAARRRERTSEQDAETLGGLSSAVRGFRGGRGGPQKDRNSNDRNGSRRNPGQGRGGRSGGGRSATRPPPPKPPSKGFGSLTSASSELLDDSLFSGDNNSSVDTWKSSSDDADIAPTIFEDLSDSEVAELLGEDTAGPDTLAGVDPVLESNLSTVLSEFKFPLDAFQIKSVRHILSGRSVVVCAPTGAGKTAIAEAAASHFIRKGGRVIYTTPLKALSNQKLGEMRERFGVEAAGLQTGDASINPDGDVVVMTTEILRNMLYRTENDPGGVAENRLANVSLVVFDECHYLGDPGRGSVWEECIINLPPNILILAMSATVRNPADLAGWISSVHGECDLVQTAFRPVPLTWQYCLTPGEEKVSLLPLLNAKLRGINPQLLPPAARLAASLRAEDEEEEDDWGRVDDVKKAGKNSNMRVRTLSELLDGLEEGDDWHRMPKWQRIPSIDGVVATLAQRKMLPAIWFIFSRKECDASVHRLAAAGTVLTNEEERAAIVREVEALRADQPEAVKNTAVPALIAGLAAHHAGCLPGWKALVEKLFQRGIVKVVFSTETLAAGINMPAKTTLLSALSRRRDAGIASLTHNELLQMAGRAGRRGYDTQGYCIIVQSRWEDPEFAYDIIRRGPEPLRSQFTTNYGMALNLLWSRTMEEAKEFLDRSYARHLSGAGAARVQAEIAALEAKAERIMRDVGGNPDVGGELSSSTDGGTALGDGTAEIEGSGAIFGSWEGDLWLRYQKLQGRRREEKRAARLLRAQLSQERGLTADAALMRLGMPRAVGLDLSGSNIDDSSYCLPGLAVLRLGSDGPLRGFEAGQYLCLGADNMVYVVGSRHISAVSEVHGIGDGAPEELVAVYTSTAEAVYDHAQRLRHARSWSDTGSGVAVSEGSAMTAGFALRLPSTSEFTLLQPSEEGLEALREQRARVTAVKSELESMRQDKRFARASKRYARASEKAGALLDKAAVLREELEGRMDGGWRKFESVVGVLEDAGAFEALGLASQSNAAAKDNGGLVLAPDRRRFTPLGLVAREVRGSNELWLATALTHEALQILRPPQLAGVISALVAPDAISRPNIQVDYPPSAEVIAAVEALEPARAELAALQIRAGLDLPVSIDLRLSGVVEGWASGLGWADITADCGLDDGDVARLLMRTVDALRQAAYCEHLLKPLRTSAKAAATAMNRKPISDLVS